uniref:Zinc knuckle CX2CX4HX4C domain-containing protein n=1 Tax=Cannabis sativa TaxID=3483 RepID=A0A803PKY1_CANSA
MVSSMDRDFLLAVGSLAPQTEAGRSGIFYSERRRKSFKNRSGTKRAYTFDAVWDVSATRDGLLLGGNVDSTYELVFGDIRDYGEFWCVCGLFVMASSSRDAEELEVRWDDLQIDEEEGGVLFDNPSELEDEVDARWVLEGTPWTFNKIPLIIQRLNLGENPRLVPLNTMEIWVQVYDLRVGFQSDRVLRACGAYIGQFVSSCPKNYSGIWREYLRVRVLINIDKPLKRRMKIYYTKEDYFWANFKYERVPTFCFICGILGHGERFCPRVFDFNQEKVVKPYGLFMKAPDRRSQKQIGARWLRDNMARPLQTDVALLGVRYSYQPTACGETDSRNQGDREDMEINEDVEGEIVGENRGIVGGIQGKRVDAVNGGISINGDAVKESSFENGAFVFTDPKRRRVEDNDELGQVTVQSLGPAQQLVDNGSGEEVITKTHVAESEMGFIEKINEGGMENCFYRRKPSWKLVFSKNELKAGTKIGPRQGL